MPAALTAAPLITVAKTAEGSGPSIPLIAGVVLLIGLLIGGLGLGLRTSSFNWLIGSQTKRVVLVNQGNEELIAGPSVAPGKIAESSSPIPVDRVSVGDVTGTGISDIPMRAAYNGDAQFGDPAVTIRPALDVDDNGRLEDAAAFDPLTDGLLILRSGTAPPPSSGAPAPGIRYMHGLRGGSLAASAPPADLTPASGGTGDVPSGDTGDADALISSIGDPHETTGDGAEPVAAPTPAGRDAWDKTW